MAAEICAVGLAAQHGGARFNEAAANGRGNLEQQWHIEEAGPLQ